MKLYYYDDKSMWRVVPGFSGALRREGVLNMLKVNILYMVQKAGAGHIGSAFSVLPIMYDLFMEVKDGDIIFSSKGHDCAAYYAILQMLGKIPFDTIHTFRQRGGLQGHPHPSDGYSAFHTGSLGMGLSKAQGLALGDKLAGRTRKIHVIVGDGELQEGQLTEAARNICKHGLWDRITMHVDMNGYQCDDVQTKQRIGVVEREAVKAIKVYNTEKGYDGNPLHAGALSEPEYERIVGELIADLPFKPVCVEHEKRGKPYVANQLMQTYTIIIDGIIRSHEKVLLLNADLAKDCGIAKLREHERFIEFGISEQDMVSAASGLAHGGFLPIVHSFAAFLCRRANEQIYNNCCEGRKIIYIGAFAGAIPYGPGQTHECLDDIALMKTMPNMMVFNPKSPHELNSCLYYAIYETDKSCYIRIPCLSEVENARE